MKLKEAATVLGVLTVGFLLGAKAREFDRKAVYLEGSHACAKYLMM